MKVGLQIQMIQSKIKEKSSGSIAGIRKIADAVVSLIVMKLCHYVIFSIDIYYIKIHRIRFYLALNYKFEHMADYY